MSIRGATLAALFVAGSLVSCSEGAGEIQIGSFKTSLKGTGLSVKQAQNSLWDFYTESSKRLSTELLLAAKSGNDLLVKDLLAARRATPNSDMPIFLSLEAKDEKGWTPLMWAVHYNHAGIARELLEEDANADTRGDDGMTPLALAIRNNNREIFDLLLDHCKAIDTPNNDGITPLMLAIAKNNLEFADELLREKASMSLRSKEGQSAVKIAYDLGNWQAVKLLLGEVKWVHIATSETGAKYYLSPQSVRRAAEDSTIAWLKEYEADPNSSEREPGQEEDEAPYSLAQVAVQCRSQQFRYLGGWNVDARGNRNDVKGWSKWEGIFPETMGHGIVAAVCEAEL